MSDQKLLTVADFVRQFRVSRTALYRLFASGELRPLKVGRRTMISLADAEAWVSRLPTAGIASVPSAVSRTPEVIAEHLRESTI